MHQHPLDDNITEVYISELARNTRKIFNQIEKNSNKIVLVYRQERPIGVILSVDQYKTLLAGK